jgi:hypothetical protein
MRTLTLFRVVLFHTTAAALNTAADAADLAVPQCLHVFGLKLPCTGSTWFNGVFHKQMTGFSVASELMQGGEYALPIDVKMARMTDRLTDACTKPGHDIHGFFQNPVVLRGADWRALGNLSSGVVTWRRTNVVKVAVSALMKNANAKNHTGCGHNLPISATAAQRASCRTAFVLDARDLGEKIHHVACQNRVLGDAARATGRRVLALHYEALQADRDAELRRFADFFGLPPARVAPPPASDGLLKKLPEGLADVIPNYGELRAFLSDDLAAEARASGCDLGAMFAATGPELFLGCNASALCGALGARFFPPRKGAKDWAVAPGEEPWPPAYA